jgi:tRNA dimethylallyltransferase
MSSRNQPPHRDSHATPRPDLVVILGTTGTGKSKLAIELASALSPNKTPEIINGDSMQVYKGLDLLTNKITTSETNSVPHHLMSFLDLDQDFTVERFRDDAIKKVRCERKIHHFTKISLRCIQ